MEKPCNLSTILYFHLNQGAQSTYQSLCQTLPNQMAEWKRNVWDLGDTWGSSLGNSGCMQHWLTLTQDVVSQSEICSSSCCATSFYFFLLYLYLYHWGNKLSSNKQTNPNKNPQRKKKNKPNNNKTHTKNENSQISWYFLSLPDSAPKWI